MATTVAVLRSDLQVVETGTQPEKTTYINWLKNYKMYSSKMEGSAAIVLPNGSMKERLRSTDLQLADVVSSLAQEHGFLNFLATGHQFLEGLQSSAPILHLC